MNRTYPSSWIFTTGRVCPASTKRSRAAITCLLSLSNEAEACPNATPVREVKSDSASEMDRRFPSPNPRVRSTLVFVHCRRSITADTALRIGKALGMTP